MLEQMRQSSRSLIIYVLFFILVAVFIINFGPQSVGGCERTVVSQNVAAKVQGREISSQDFRYGYTLAGGGQYSVQIARQRRLKETIMDKLIERELLASEAERLGFRVSDEEVEDLLMESKIVGLGFEQTIQMFQKDGKFNYDMFRRFVLYQMGMSPRAFIDEQRREMLAQRVRQLLRAGVGVSNDELKADFLRKNNQVSLEYVRVPVSRYESDVDATPEEIDGYVKNNEAKLKELYTSRKFLYEKAPKERKLRSILVKTDPGASDDAVAAAKKKAEGLAARIHKGEAFAAVARAASDDARGKARGGELGWRRQGTTALGTEIEEKVWAAKDGEVVGPLKGSDGFYLVVAEGAREGDIPFEQVKRELAEDQLRQDRAKAKAKAEAEAVLAKAKAAPAKTLKDLFPAPSDKDATKTGAAQPLQAEETGLFIRRGNVVEGIGVSPELAKAAFDLTKEQPFAAPAEVAGSYVVAKLKERKSADLAEFDKKKLELEREATAAKGEEVVEEWALRRCNEAKEARKIDINKEVLRYEAGPEGAVSYEPCSPPFRL
jgi:peptidyl-prolyl cis-trans isomerase D